MYLQSESLCSSTLGRGFILSLAKVQKPLKFSLKVLFNAKNASFICEAIKNCCTDLYLVVTEKAVSEAGISKREKLVKDICQKPSKPTTTRLPSKSTGRSRPSKLQTSTSVPKYLHNVTIKYTNTKGTKTMFFLSVGEADRKSLQKIFKCA